MASPRKKYKCSVCGLEGHTSASGKFHTDEERHTARKERDARIAALKKQHRAMKQHKHVDKANPLPQSASKMVLAAAASKFNASVSSARDDTQADEPVEKEAATDVSLEQLQLRVKELEAEVAALKAFRQKCKANHRLTGSEKKRRKRLAWERAATIDLP